MAPARKRAVKRVTGSYAASHPKASYTAGGAPKPKKKAAPAQKKAQKKALKGPMTSKAKKATRKLGY